MHGFFYFLDSFVAFARALDVYQSVFRFQTRHVLQAKVRACLEANIDLISATVVVFLLLFLYIVRHVAMTLWSTRVAAAVEALKLQVRLD